MFTGTRNTRSTWQRCDRRGIAVGYTERGPSKDEHLRDDVDADPRGREAARAVHALAARRRLARRPPHRCPACWTASGSASIGFGEIGQRVARVGAGLRHGGRDLEPAHDAGARGGERVRCVPLDELLATSEVVSLHLVPAEGPAICWTPRASR